PGGPQVNGSYSGASPQQMHVHAGNVGTYVDPVDGPPFPPREGEKIVILSSGIASNLLNPNLGTGIGCAAPCPTTSFNSSLGNNLPAPLSTNSVSATEDCLDNPALVGMGDCSNTIEDQFTQGSGAYDYAELRFTTEVPAGTFGFSYDFAFFSSEYPTYYGG